MARALVTGGAGFVGSHIVEALRRDGHDVMVADDLSTGRRENLPPDVELAEVDVAGDEFLAVAKKFGPDTITHAAAQASVSVSMRDPVRDARVNIGGALNVCQAAIESGCEQVVYLNTGGALYGEPDYLPCDENHPIRPISAYGLSKWTAERYFQMLLPQSIPLKSLRVANVYGPRQDPRGEAGVVAIFTHLLLRAERVQVYGDGEQTRDYVHAADVASAHGAAMGYGRSIVANVGTGRGTAVNHIFGALRDLIGADVEPSYAPSRLGDVRHITLDAARARTDLGWSPRVSLSEGLAETVENFRGRHA